MRRSAVVLVVLLAAVLGGCARDDTPMTAADARAFARRALEEVGFRQVRVDEKVVAGRSDDEPSGTAAGAGAVPVWKTVSHVAGGGTAEIWVTRRGSSAVFLQDVAAGGGPLLTDQQVRRLARFRFNPAAERHRDRVVGPGIAATLLLALSAAGLGVAVQSGRVGAARPSEGRSKAV